MARTILKMNFFF